jgi:hypothetical protein
MIVFSHIQRFISFANKQLSWLCQLLLPLRDVLLTGDNALFAFVMAYIKESMMVYPLKDDTKFHVSRHLINNYFQDIQRFISEANKQLSWRCQLLYHKHFWT